MMNLILCYRHLFFMSSSVVSLTCAFCLHGNMEKPQSHKDTKDKRFTKPWWLLCVFASLWPKSLSKYLLNRADMNIKVCGITQLKQLQELDAMDIDFAGLN